MIREKRERSCDEMRCLVRYAEQILETEIWGRERERAVVR
jgi:hypothetical protein